MCYLNDLNTRWGVEPEKAIWQRNVLLHFGKPEIRRSTVRLLNHNSGDLMGRRNLQQHLGNSIVHTFGDTAQNDPLRLQRGNVRRERKPIEFLGQLGLAQEISKRRANVVDLL